MGAIAKGEITLSPVNDAYTVLLTPASCTINADFNGDNPRLANASGQISVKRGAIDVPFIATACGYSGSNIAVTITGNRFKLDRISTRDLSGWVDFRIEVNDGFGYETTCRFSFTVVRETTMLDWILDWENNKTKIGDSYIMTPKMFIGRKEDVAETIEVEGSVETRWVEGALTGVYIGPDLLSSGENSTGIYGYLQNQEIFHLNAEGGMIGGWDIANGGIQTADGRLRILSEGTIISQTESITHWALYADGRAVFANGNVTFQSDGDASFKGSITAESGTLGGWQIEEDGLRNGPILIDAEAHYIGIAADTNWSNPPLKNESTTNADLHKASIQLSGGVALSWSSYNEYGLVAYNASGLVAQIGATNKIAGWSFDNEALYLGTKGNSPSTYTPVGNNITIGTKGMRGSTWYIDSNGRASFAKGKILFTADGNATLAGWGIGANSISTDHIKLLATDSLMGLFVSNGSIVNVEPQDLVGQVAQGGVMIYYDANGAHLDGYVNSGEKIFGLNHMEGFIAGWTFSDLSIWHGSNSLDGTTHFTTSPNSIVISANSGLHGSQWYLGADGAGSIAGGKISWTSDGQVSFGEGVILSWANISGALDDKLTFIDQDEVRTWTLNAVEVVACNIKQSSTNPTWELKTDGTGQLASGNIEWDIEGNTRFKGAISQDAKFIHHTNVARKIPTGEVSEYPYLTSDRWAYKLNKHLCIICNAYSQEVFENTNVPVDPIKKWGIVLPTGAEYVGREVTIYDNNFGPYNTNNADKNTLICLDDENCDIVGIAPTYTSDPATLFGWKALKITGGYAKFVGLPLTTVENNEVKTSTQWICTQYGGAHVICYSKTPGGSIVVFDTNLKQLTDENP